MDILGVGPLELLAILIVALIFMGPRDMVKAGHTIGRFLRRIVTSPMWGAVQDTSKTIRNLPTTLMREAGMEDDVEDLRSIGRDLNKEAAMLGSLKNSIRGGADALNNDVRQASGLSAWTTPTPPPAQIAPQIAPPPAPAGALPAVIDPPEDLPGWQTAVPPGSPAVPDADQAAPDSNNSPA